MDLSDPSKLQWLYIDNSGVTQGPFLGEKMIAWQKLGFFQETTKVKLPAEIDFVALKDHPHTFLAKPPAPPAPVAPVPPPAPPVVAPATGESVAEKEEEEEDVTFDESADLWLYLDDDSNEQGPFDGSLMANWFKAGFFTLETKCRKAKDKDKPFVAIKERTDCLFAGQAPPVAPASAAPLTVAPPPVKWFYLDDESCERGPWSEKQMKLWCSKGFFDPHEEGCVKVRKESEGIFRNLAEWQGPLPAWALGHQPPKRISGVSNALSLIPSAFPFMPALNAIRPPLPPPLLPGQQEPDWVYLDKDGVEQGPWSSAQMRLWYHQGLLSPQVRVKEKGSSAPWTPIGARPCCFVAPLGDAAASVPLMAGPLIKGTPQASPPPPQGAIPHAAPSPPSWMARPPAPGPPPADYVQTAAFRGNNRFSAALAPGQAPVSHWEQKGLANDPNLRQMGHFFDFDKWQEERNSAKKARV